MTDTAATDNDKVYYIYLRNLLETIHCSCRALPEPCISCSMRYEDANNALPEGIERVDVSRIPPLDETLDDWLTARFAEVEDVAARKALTAMHDDIHQICAEWQAFADNRNRRGSVKHQEGK